MGNDRPPKMSSEFRVSSHKQISQIVAKYHCFYISKISLSTTLCLHQGFIDFESGNSNDKIYITYSEIKEVAADKGIGSAVNNLEIKTKNRSYLFSGLHEAESIKELITLLQLNDKAVQPLYGFTSNNQEVIEYKELNDPKEVVKKTLNFPFQTVVDLIRKKEFMDDFFLSTGNEDVHTSDFTKLDTCDERDINYLKLIVVPVFGKNLTKVREIQRFFTFDGKMIISVTSELGKTPYAECFDPLVQVVFVDNGNKTEFSVLFEMFWKSQPTFKNIIQTQTEKGIKDSYEAMIKKIITDLGGDAEGGEETPENNEENEKSNDMTNVVRIFKVSILLLIVAFLVIVIRKNWPKDGMHLNSHVLFAILSFVLFDALLLYF
ncbi:hypothetical protein GPJ56_000943 [Histomonas meleagridis]|uniref:uncharacterized protein n=1 Tax=Histomonas meleagridis TaxID=135588 RepID=UPI00355A26A3|nr:hypothetical protein GPJ56_000943 [Histomonas meleagridis]KAH0803778.1 hypothetical protein GO595_002608 [Histomonas meleagridis]